MFEAPQENAGSFTGTGTTLGDAGECLWKWISLPPALHLEEARVSFTKNKWGNQKRRIRQFPLRFWFNCTFFVLTLLVTKYKGFFQITKYVGNNKIWSLFFPVQHTIDTDYFQNCSETCKFLLWQIHYYHNWRLRNIWNIKLLTVTRYQPKSGVSQNASTI